MSDVDAVSQFSCSNSSIVLDAQLFIHAVSVVDQLRVAVLGTVSQTGISAASPEIILFIV